LPDGSAAALDTNTIIYYVEEHPDYLPALMPVFDRIRDGRLSGHVSVMSVMEVLVLPIRASNQYLANRYREMLRDSANVWLHEISEAIAERAASLRALYRLTPPDAIVVATAVEAGCTHLVTNDSRFRAVPGIEVLVIREHADETRV
jgi:predicted nucleic acid-binding protein